jgi:hypothetical protein
MRKKFRIAILVALLIGVICLFLFNPQAEYQLAQSKELERWFEADAFAVRNEETIIAPCDGIIEILVSEGVRVPAKTTIAMVGNVPVITNKAGTISWSYDGLETIIGPGVLMGLKQQFLNDWDKPINHSKTGISVYKGETIGKLVDNYAWHLIIFSDMSARRGEKLTVEINGKSYTGIVREVLTDNRLSVEIESYRDEVATYRVLRRIKIQKEPLFGVVVDEGQLIETEDGSYLEIKYKNKEKRQPVRVVGRWQGKVVVDGIPQGAKILVKPK